jgi:hypothetical protein
LGGAKWAGKDVAGELTDRIDLRLADPKLLTAVEQYCAQRLESLRGFRLSWWANWAELASLFLPRRYKWFVTPNNYGRGSPINQRIVDETGVLAARILYTGLLSGLTSPTKPWFSFGLAGEDELEEGPAQQWLAAVSERTLDILGGTNFYQMWAQALHDLVVFGSSPMIQYEHPTKVVHFHTPCAGEYMFALSADLEVDTLYREYTYTLSELVKEFGLENVSASSKQAYMSPSNLDMEVVVCHAMEPNLMIYQAAKPIGYVVPKRFKFREVYWERGGSGNGTQQTSHLLRAAGFREQPFSGLRWDVTSNDPYGRSPGMDAYPAVAQLQVQQRRLAEAIEKQVRPPMIGSAMMRNEPMDINAGGITFVNNPQAEGFKPAFTVQPNVSEMTENIKEVQARVFRIFFNDLFLGISQLGTVRSATEIEARQSETLIQIGPVIERTESELDRTLGRTFAVCQRRGMYPPPPPELAGRTLTINYVSLFSEVQRAALTNAIERFVSFVGTVAGSISPQAWDNVDEDEMIDEYAERIHVPPNILRSVKAVMQIRAQRAQEQQQAAALQVGSAAASGAATLSKADVGGGQNALQAMLGTGGPGSQPMAAAA